MDYGDDAFYTDLAARAIDGWREWNDRAPWPLYHATGILLLSRSRVRDAVFGEPAGHPRLRVEAVSDGVRVDASEEHGSSLEGELEPGGPAATETSRSAARVE